MLARIILRQIVNVGMSRQLMAENTSQQIAMFSRWSSRIEEKGAKLIVQYQHENCTVQEYEFYFGMIDIRDK